MSYPYYLGWQEGRLGLEFNSRDWNYYSSAYIDYMTGWLNSKTVQQ